MPAAQGGGLPAFAANQGGGQTSTLLPERELAALAAAVTAGHDNGAYRFRTLVINTEPDPAKRQRPQGVDEPTWRDALSECGGERNAENMWPQLVMGFEGLCARYAEQTAALTAQHAALQALVQEASKRARRRQVAIAARLERLRAVHEEQCIQLLRAARVGDALDARAAPWAPEPLRPQEVDLLARLKRLSAEVSAAKGGARSLSARVDALRAVARHRGGPAALPGAAASEAVDGHQRPRMDDESLATAAKVLAEQADALRALADVVKRDARYVAILEEQEGGGNGARAMD